MRIGNIHHHVEIFDKILEKIISLMIVKLLYIVMLEHLYGKNFKGIKNKLFWTWFGIIACIMYSWINYSTIIKIAGWF